MSGFAGIVRLDPTPENMEGDGTAIVRMAEAIAFRGPDRQQQVVQDGAAFAFSLLTTGPAPQAPAQPVTLDGKTFFFGEARFDGRQELIEKLKQHGDAISPSPCDEELVLRFVERFGLPALPELDGDFSFVLWRPHERKLFAFRDLCGARPFFYAHRDGAFCFSNTFQAVLASNFVSLSDYDLQFVGDFLLGSPHHDPERTIYRDVRRLQAGRLLEFSTERLSVRRIASFAIEDLLPESPAQGVVDEFRRLLRQAISDRLPNGETAILLSGGLDSTSIAAGIVSLRKQGAQAHASRLHALCIDYLPLFPDDEAEYASRLAEQLGIPLRIMHSGGSLPFEGWESRAGFLPEPLADPYALLYLSYRRELSGVSRVVFSGDGGDEILRLQAASYLRFLWSSKGPMAAVAALAQWILAHRALPPLGLGLRSGLMRMLGRKTAEDFYPPWLATEFEQECGLRERWMQMQERHPDMHPFNPQAYRALNGGLFGDVQELCDPTWTRVPLETRNPFLDRRLCRFALRLPVVPWAINKQLIRAAMIGVLPEEIRLRAKTPVFKDPLALQKKNGQWNPTAASEAIPTIPSGFIDPRRLMVALSRAQGMELYVHLRAWALALWLDVVEKAKTIY